MKFNPNTIFSPKKRLFAHGIREIIGDPPYSFYFIFEHIKIILNLSPIISQEAKSAQDSHNFHIITWFSLLPAIFSSHSLTISGFSRIPQENEDISSRLLNIKQNGWDIDIQATMTASTSTQSNAIKSRCYLQSKHKLYCSAATSTISRSTCDRFHNVISKT